MRLLLVEDDQKLGTLLQHGLEEEGFAVTLVRDGETAIASALEGEYDLIVLDYMLPRRNGREVAAEVRRHGRTTPILMVTARDAPDDLRYALQAGVDELIGKPFRFAELVDRVRALVHGHRNPT
jgi:DNA-binding response OmpR family regulator